MDRKLFLSYIQNMQRNNPDMTGFQNSLRANSWIAPKPIVEQALSEGSGGAARPSKAAEEAMRKAAEEAARKAAEAAGGGGAAPPANETPYEKKVREARERKNGEEEAKAEAERRAKSRKEFDDASAWWSDPANVDIAVEWDASNPMPQFTPRDDGIIDGSGLRHNMEVAKWKNKRRQVIPFDDPGTTDYEEYDKKHKERNKPIDFRISKQDKKY